MLRLARIPGEPRLLMAHLVLSGCEFVPIKLLSFKKIDLYNRVGTGVKRHVS